MDYSIIRDTYLQSSLIRQIPDRFAESLPIFFWYGEERCVGWFYWVGRKEADVQGLAAVQMENGTVVWISADELEADWAVDLTPSKLPEITDYKAYLEKKKSYLHDFSNLFRGIGNGQLYVLLEEIFGEELYQRVFLPVIKNVKRPEGPSEA